METKSAKLARGLTKNERAELEQSIKQRRFIETRRGYSPLRNAFYYRCLELRMPYVVITPRRKFAWVEMECSLETYERIDLPGKRQIQELFRKYGQDFATLSTTVGWSDTPLELSEQFAAELFQIGIDFIKRKEVAKMEKQPQRWSDLLSTGKAGFKQALN